MQQRASLSSQTQLKRRRTVRRATMDQRNKARLKERDGGGKNKNVSKVHCWNTNDFRHKARNFGQEGSELHNRCTLSFATGTKFHSHEIALDNYNCSDISNVQRLMDTQAWVLELLPPNGTKIHSISVKLGVAMIFVTRQGTALKICFTQIHIKNCFNKRADWTKLPKPTKSTVRRFLVTTFPTLDEYSDHLMWPERDSQQSYFGLRVIPYEWQYYDDPQKFAFGT